MELGPGSAEVRPRIPDGRSRAAAEEQEGAVGGVPGQRRRPPGRRVAGRVDLGPVAVQVGPRIRVSAGVPGSPEQQKVPVRRVPGKCPVVATGRGGLRMDLGPVTGFEQPGIGQVASPSGVSPEQDRVAVRGVVRKAPTVAPGRRSRPRRRTDIRPRRRARHARPWPWHPGRTLRRREKGRVRGRTERGRRPGPRAPGRIPREGTPRRGRAPRRAGGREQRVPRPGARAGGGCGSSGVLPSVTRTTDPLYFHFWRRYARAGRPPFDLSVPPGPRGEAKSPCGSAIR